MTRNAVLAAMLSGAEIFVRRPLGVGKSVYRMRWTTRHPDTEDVIYSWGAHPSESLVAKLALDKLIDTKAQMESGTEYVIPLTTKGMRVAQQVRDAAVQEANADAR